VRLAELVAALSLGVDLGFGQPMEHMLRQCLIALRLAERRGLDEAERAVVYYTALLIVVGCHTDAYEQARWFGDDIALKSGKYEHELGSLRAAVAGVRQIGAGNPPLRRVRVAAGFALGGHRSVQHMIEHHAEMAQMLAADLGLSSEVARALGSAYEQWDGRGWPGELGGETIPIASRIAQFAEFIEVAHRLEGVDAAVELARRRAGRQFDPGLCTLLLADPDAVLEHVGTIGAWDAVIDSEPALRVALSGERLDAALLAVANFADLKSPYALGHAPAVAALAADAGARVGLPAAELTTLRRAGLVHDLGRLGVSNAIWDRPGPLGAGEWERVRMVPYLTERMLHQSETLAPLGVLAAQHRERLDGSGYPHGLMGAAISPAARVLGAADAYRAMREPRPYREPFTAEASARELRADVRAGRLDADAVEAVLGAAGHRAARRPDGVAGLTAREVEVLRLLARGCSNREIADRLVIAPKTAGNHVEHIYAKLGVSNRAAAGLFAVRHGLITDNT
jgi:HD-GYP domain-containing protein (c-di-GMP phosphodiesterase class II)